ncbi:MAG: thioredoxin family protein [Bradymonadia bacterium]
MSTITDLTDENFESELAGAELAIVDFYAGWCGPCRMFAPKFKRLAKKYTQVRFFKLNGEEAPNARKTVTIDTLPYFAAYKNGELLGGFSTQKEDKFVEFFEGHFGPAPEEA